MLMTFFAFLSSSLETVNSVSASMIHCVNREDRGLPIPSASCLSLSSKEDTLEFE